MEKFNQKTIPKLSKTCIICTSTYTDKRTIKKHMYINKYILSVQDSKAQYSYYSYRHLPRLELEHGTSSSIVGFRLRSQPLSHPVIKQ